MIASGNPESKRKNAGKAISIRSARAILKTCPLGAKAGDTFIACQRKKMTVIDPAPVKRTVMDENGQDRTVWEQKFEQSGSVKVYGEVHEFSGTVRIVWDYKPTMETILDFPRFEWQTKQQ